MPLVVCDEVHGGAHIDRDPLVVHQPRGVVMIPFGQAQKPGVYDASGKLFRPAAYFRGLPEPHTPLEEEATPLDIASVDYAPDTHRYVFGGHLTGHFGHFMFSILARLWSLPSPLPADLKIVLLNGGSAPDVFEIEFIASIFAVLGISLSSFAVFHQPVRFHTLEVPSPSAEENHQVHQAFAELCHRIGRSLLSDTPLRVSDRPVYLTKRALASGVHRIVNEDAFCARLERLGVDIVSPEQLTLQQQVAIWAQRRIVGAMFGSMLHTSIFVPARAYVALNTETWINSNQAMIDTVNANRSRILIPDAGYVRTAGTMGFHHDLRLADPRQTADEFFKAMMQARDEERRRAGKPWRAEAVMRRLWPGVLSA
jgi:hypothetical protein